MSCAASNCSQRARSCERKQLFQAMFRAVVNGSWLCVVLLTTAMPKGVFQFSLLARRKRFALWGSWQQHLGVINSQSGHFREGFVYFCLFCLGLPQRLVKAWGRTKQLELDEGFMTQTLRSRNKGISTGQA